MMEKKEFKLGDDVWQRVAQAVQESMITMTDVVDTLRMIRVSESSDGSLVLSESYKKYVKDMHLALVEEGKAKLAERSRGEK